MRNVEYNLFNVKGAMKSKIASILVILFFSTAALASTPAVFECSYALYSSMNGKPISSGTANVLFEKNTKIQLQNPLSELKSLNVAVHHEFQRTNPDGGIDWFSLKSTKTPSFGTFYNTDMNGNLTFGDRKVFGSMKVGKSQSYYYQRINGTISTRIFIEDLGRPTTHLSGGASSADSIVRQHHQNSEIACVGGTLNDAANELKKSFPHIVTDIDVQEHMLSWNYIKSICLGEVEDDGARGGRRCLEWTSTSVHVEIPACTN
jgi:hypothetical protein